MPSGFGHWTGSNDGGGGGFPAGLVAAAAAAGVVVWAVAWLVPRVWVAVVCVCVACGATGIGLAVREVRRFPSWRPAVKKELPVPVTVAISQPQEPAAIERVPVVVVPGVVVARRDEKVR